MRFLRDVCRGFPPDLFRALSTLQYLKKTTEESPERITGNRRIL